MATQNNTAPVEISKDQALTDTNFAGLMAPANALVKKLYAAIDVAQGAR